MTDLPMLALTEAIAAALVAAQAVPARAVDVVATSAAAVLEFAGVDNDGRALFAIATGTTTSASDGELDDRAVQERDVEAEAPGLVVPGASPNRGDLAMRVLRASRIAHNDNDARSHAWLAREIKIVAGRDVVAGEATRVLLRLDAEQLARILDRAETICHAHERGRAEMQAAAERAAEVQP